MKKAYFVILSISQKWKELQNNVPLAKGTRKIMHGCGRHAWTRRHTILILVGAGGSVSGVYTWAPWRAVCFQGGGTISMRSPAQQQPGTRVSLPPFTPQWQLLPTLSTTNRSKEKLNPPRNENPNPARRNSRGFGFWNTLALIILMLLFLNIYVQNRFS